MEDGNAIFEAGALLTTASELQVWGLKFGGLDCKSFRYILRLCKGPTRMNVDPDQTPIRSSTLQPEAAPEQISLSTLSIVVLCLGAAGAVASTLWWAIFFRTFSNELHRRFGSDAITHNLGGVVECLYQPSGVCGKLAALATVNGYIPYQPLALWVSIVAILIGTGMYVHARRL